MAGPQCCCILTQFGYSHFGHDGLVEKLQQAERARS